MAKRQYGRRDVSSPRLRTIRIASSRSAWRCRIKTSRRPFARSGASSIAPRRTRCARYNLALVLQRADRLAEAAKELQRTIDTEPRAEAYYSLGVVRWHQGDLEQATAALRAAITAEPGYASAHEALGGVLRDRRDWAGAAAAFRRAISLRPDTPGPYFALARVLQSSGDQDGARRAIADGERLWRRSQAQHEALVWTAVGAAKLDRGALVAALDDFRRAVAADDTYAPAHYQMGRTLHLLSQPDAAQAAFARAQQLDPSLVPPTRDR